MGRKLLWASLALAPATIALDLFADLEKTALFALSAASLVPLAWLIGEATEHAGEHMGPGIGGFLNASFGNAPELIIALAAVGDRLPEVVRGSLAGSVVSNLLLVLGVTLIAGTEAPLDRRSLLVQVGLILLAVLAFLVPSVPGFHGNPERLSLAYATIPVAIFLLCVYLAVTIAGLRRHSRIHAAEAEDAEEPAGWPLWVALTALAVATAATAFVSEILVHSLDEFAKTAGLSKFFISAVIVAVVGNAAEHGGAVVVAHRGKMRLATEIAISSGAQVALLVASAVALLSFLFPHPLPLSFRPVELVAMGGAAAIVAVAVAGGRSTRRAGVMLVSLYAVVVVGFWIAGDR